MKLTEHFTLEELTRSDTARAIGDENRPGPGHLENLQRLAKGLEEVRALFGVPMEITSGYRNPRVNAAVRGVPNSDHASGLAADFHVRDFTDLAAAKIIRDSGIRFDQLILEHGRCIHLSFHPRLRQQVLRQPGGAGSPVYDGLEA